MGKIYSRHVYYEQEKCDNCSMETGWRNLVTVKLSDADRWIYNRNFLNLCPNCYGDLKEHKYIRGGLKPVFYSDSLEKILDGLKEDVDK